MEEKVCIICPIHGEFWQTPNDHLSGYGCPECGKISKKKYTLDIFKKKAQEIHGNKYRKPDKYDLLTKRAAVALAVGEIKTELSKEEENVEKE
mgnify:CR=1 FL=1